MDFHPLCLGGNVFGWTADEITSLAVLDAYADAGGSFVDTANSYSAWLDGHTGGESEAIIGKWLERSGRRDAMVVATKVGGRMPAFHGLTRDIVTRACDASLNRLRTDRIDLYYAHFDHPETPLEETWGAFDELVKAGKVRELGISNHAPDRVREVLQICAREGFHAPIAMQPHYNLVEREYETTLRPVAEETGLAVIPYYGLARGFLAGKYRPGAGPVESARAGGASKYLETEAGPRVLEALDEVAASHGVPVAAVSLAWLVAQPTVVSAIASARTTEQLAELLPMATLELTDADQALLDAAARGAETAAD